MIANILDVLKYRKIIEVLNDIESDGSWACTDAKHSCRGAV